MGSGGGNNQSDESRIHFCQTVLKKPVDFVLGVMLRKYLRSSKKLLAVDFFAQKLFDPCLLGGSMGTYLIDFNRTF